MSRILFDFMCMAHGKFESSEEICPYGCTGKLVRKIFLQAPGIVSDRTRNIDRTLSGLASDFNLSDMSNRGGEAVVRPDVNKQRQQEEYQKYIEARFGKTGFNPLAAGGTYKVGGGVGNADRGGGAVDSMAAIGAQSDNALVQVQDILTQPTPIVVAKHDGKIDTSHEDT